jgi:plasmid stability protein
MATLTVRNLPDEALAKLRVLAAEHGRSMEAEARDVLVAIAEGGSVVRSAVRPTIEERVARAQAKIRAELGELPKGRVDAFLAERKAAAERGE